MLHMCMVYESKPTVVLEPIVQGCSSTSLARTLRGEMANQSIADNLESTFIFKIILRFKSF